MIIAYAADSRLQQKYDHIVRFLTQIKTGYFARIAKKMKKMPWMWRGQITYFGFTNRICQQSKIWS